MKLPRILILIFALAFFVRVINLNIFPVGFHADEVRVGWNAYSILKTFKDDRGNILALYYNTFGDYRPTGIFYFTIPSIIIFGLNEFAIRFPSAFIGALTVFPIYWLALLLTKQKQTAVLSAFFLSLSPWHISTSRATSEVVISMFFAILAVVFVKKKIFLSLGLFFISYLLYHSIRLLAPIFLLTLFFYGFEKVINKKALQVLSVFVIISISSGVLFLTAGGRGRFTQVSILHSNSTTGGATFGGKQVLGSQTTSMFFDNSLVLSIKSFLSEYSKYFSGDFLIGETAKPLRYKTPNVGMLFFSEIILIGIGIFLSVKKKVNPVVLILLLVSPLPAALTSEDSPNLHRSLFMVPFLVILAASGAAYLLRSNKLLLAILLLVFSAEWMFYWHSYTERAPYLSSAVRDSAAKSLALYLNEVGKNYEKVIITNDPDDPYPWFAFFTKKDPREFNEFAVKRSQGPWKYQNFEFTQKECPSGDIFPNKFQYPLQENVLVIDAFKCPVGSKINDGMQAKVVKQFFHANGQVAYTAWEKNER